MAICLDFENPKIVKFFELKTPLFCDDIVIINIETGKNIADY